MYAASVSGLPRLSALRSGARRLATGHGELDVAQTQTAAPGKYRTMEDLPGPSLATTAYWLFAKGYAEKTHVLQMEHKKIYGPMWRSKFGSFNVVNVASAELISKVIRQEGQYPLRTDLPHWKEYLDLRGRAYGIHVSTGAEWYRLRSALNPKMLKLKEVSAYAPVIHQVVGDLLQRLEVLRLRSKDRTTVSNLTELFYRFGFEGISTILFETRLGCLQEEIPKDTLRFIAATNDMLSLSNSVLFFPQWTRGILPFWKDFVKAWDDLYDVAETLINKKMEEIDSKLSRGKQVEGMYLTYLLSSGKLTKEEIYISITELLLGGVDTTSNTLSWTLYHLAQDMDVQEQLHNEVTSVCPGQQLPNIEDLKRMPYMKAIIKEILRLYPVVPGNGRLVTEKEVILDNYWFPEKTQFHLCHFAASHDESEFPDAERFIPERWLRGTPTQSQHHPYSSIPFGVGVRACVGKRVAELEMYFLLSRLVQRYKVKPGEAMTTIEPKTRTLLIPGNPINLKFIPRV
ncbi:cytochrome P450 27C1 isoform X1 [Denticeps clupeoides]|nr:cytochrome P450 27C1-like isoform X1 [Denticeps clupeoides]